MTEPTGPKPFLLRPRNPCSPRPRMSWYSVALLMRLLHEGPHTMAELIEETGLAASTVRGYVKALRKEKLVAIVYRLISRNGNPSIHVYQWKPGAKDYYVKKKTSAERQAASRARKREATVHAVLGTEIRVPLAPRPADCGEAGHAEGRCGNASCLPKPPAPYTAEELERDNPYNAWVSA